MMTLQAQVVELLREQKQHLLKHDEQISNQEKNLEKLDELMERQQQQIEHQQQQLDTMQRFNVQTRQMWIAVARKVDLDYEDPDLEP